MTTSAAIRQKLGLSRSDWARALRVNERTVARWEDGNVDPGGLALEVMRGIASALEEGVDAKRASRMVSLGIGSLLFSGLMSQRR